MTIKLRKQTIEILEVIKNKRSNIVATNLAKEMKLDYIVLMSAVNELIDNKLGGFEEEEIYQISLNDEGDRYLENGLPERQLLNLLLKDNIKEITKDELLKRSKFDQSIFLYWDFKFKEKQMGGTK